MEGKPAITRVQDPIRLLIQLAVTAVGLGVIWGTQQASNKKQDDMSVQLEEIRKEMTTSASEEQVENIRKDLTSFQLRYESTTANLQARLQVIEDRLREKR